MGRMPDSPHEGGDGKATGVGASVRTNGEAARENSGSTGVSRGVVGGSSLLTERGWYPPEAQLQPSLSGVLKTDNCQHGCPSLTLPGERGGEAVNPTSFTCPLNTTDYKCDIKGTLDADNQTDKKIPVKLMA